MAACIREMLCSCPMLSQPTEAGMGSAGADKRVPAGFAYAVQKEPAVTCKSLGEMGLNTFKSVIDKTPNKAVSGNTSITSIWLNLTGLSVETDKWFCLRPAERLSCQDAYADLIYGNDVPCLP